MTVVHSPLSSLEAIHATIKNDKFTRLWLLYLIYSKDFKPLILKEAGIQNACRELRVCLYLHFILYCATFGAIILSIYQNSATFMLASVGVFFLYWLVKMQLQRLIIRVGSFVIEQDYLKEGFEYKTLFQICEFYSRKFKILSLVSLISGLDQYCRKIFWGGLFFLLCLMPTAIWKPWASYLTIAAAFVYFLPFHFIQPSKKN